MGRPVQQGEEEQMLTRRDFIRASAVAAGLAGLAGCSATGDGSAKDAAPTADQYPIEPDGSDVKAKYTSEETRDGWTRYINPDGGAEIGVADTARMIQVSGLAFRDANGNGKLDFYEDWRQTNEDRAKSLAEQLSAEEILPLMWHNGFTSSSAPLDDGTIETLQEGMRAGVSRANTSLDTYATDIAFVNAVQTWCEQNDAHGIPYMNSTDPYQLYDIPDPHCLASTFDKDVWKKSGHYIGRAWRSAGFRVDLGPQVDIGTNIIYGRMGGSMCEDPATNRDEAKAYAGGMQSTWSEDMGEDQGWGKDSVACMFKHFVGGGAVEGGRNDHNDAGKYDVFPGENFDAHLIPFLDGGLELDSETSQMAAVMPNYGIAYSEDGAYGPLWGGAYNARNIGILRNAGWDGMVTTDWQILRPTDFGDRAHGVKDMSEAERFEKLLEATVDQVGGDWAPEIAAEGYKLYEQTYGTEEALSRVRDSARRIFTVMNQVQLFDQPYSDRTYCKEVLEDEKAAEFGEEASVKSIVMLKNKGSIIAKGGIQGKPKCYIPQKLMSTGGMFSQGNKYFTLAIDEDAANSIFTVLTDTVGEPTGTAAAAVGSMAAQQSVSTDPVYQESDAVMPSDEELADCEYVVFTIASPDTGQGEPSGGGMFGAGAVTEGPKYLPISLQYRPYTADTARDPSLAGDIVDGVKENRSYRGQSVTASNEEDLDKLISLKEKAPNAKIILIVEATNNAQCFHEIEPYADVILWSWASSGRNFGKAYGKILAGDVEPSGMLPCQMPIDMLAVEASQEDVPRDVDCYKDSEGNVYDFCFGLNWSGKIDDDRYKTYSAVPLTEPEHDVKPGEWSA